MTRPIDRIRDFIIAKCPEAEHLTPETDLIASRAIDSLQFVEFLCFLEEACGRKIDYETLNVDDVRTLRRIEDVFLTDQHATEAAS